MSVTKQKGPRAKGTPAAREMLGDSPPGERIDPRWRKQLSRLVNLRDYLLQGKHAQFKDAVEESPTFSMHMADAGTDSYDRDLALSMLSHQQNAVYEIEEALNRIRDGTYGVCEMTGKKIPAERLEAIPWTRFTAEAERTLEKRGEFQRAQLGPRESVGREQPAGGPGEEP
jgi:RNA polymerase-binding transcription factor DksA